MGRSGKWSKSLKRWAAGVLAVILGIPALPGPSPSLASEIWPQKSTAPYYCLDGGKGWKSTDRYEIYRYDTLPSPLTEVQARRLFWAYPTNWNALKEAAAGRDPELYAKIAPVSSGPNVVKRIKDDKNTMFAWVADNPEIEQRAIAVLEQAVSESVKAGKEAPEAIREATSEERAVSFTVPPFSDGPGALDTEFVLGKEFIRDIAGIEAQSVWDNGSGGGNEGWLDASQDRNIAKSVLGENLYEITWSGDSIRIHNNGSAVANENAVGSSMSAEEKYNKTTVRYKITMRKDSGWYTEGQWSGDYLKEWMDFKACVNAPGQQRLYKADMRIVPSDVVFYLVIGQEGSGEPSASPEYGTETSEVDFQVFRHDEILKADYNVKLTKLDDETGMPLKGSQFYLYERFEDAGKLDKTERAGGLLAENLNFRPWDGFRVFAEGTTNENGELFHTDTRTYHYSKTYCDGHGMPSWASVPDEEDQDSSGEEGEESGDSESGTGDGGAEEARDQNRRAAEQWLELYYACQAEADDGAGTHFHWLRDPAILAEVLETAESGMPEDAGGSGPIDSRTAFERSGCREDCEETYDKFRNLKFTYTWKEIQARTGYIRHDLHEEDIPVELVVTVSSEAGAEAELISGSSRDITETIWFDGIRKNTEAGDRLAVSSAADSSPQEGIQLRSVSEWLTERISDSDAEMDHTETIWSFKKKVLALMAEEDREHDGTETETASDANAAEPETPSDAGYGDSGEEASLSRIRYITAPVAGFLSEGSGDAKRDNDEEWESGGGTEHFRTYLEAAKEDGIRHLKTGSDDRLSYPETESGRDSWIVRDHRTEGKIHINKRDMDLYRGESGEYSSYGDTEGDGTLAGALYGLFAAEDLIHPDSDLASDGTVTNTGIVYRKHDLTAVAETDEDGDAVFSVYTAAPGSTWNYETQSVEKRPDADWTGPENRYEGNREKYGNWWIGRPLILGEYYVKELSRSEGYECSVNGKNSEWTSYGTGFETPDTGSSAGTAVISVQDPAASMEGEDGSGAGYDRFSFTVTSTGTCEPENENAGYRILLCGFPENTEFYRVDTGEEQVTGPHVTGTETVIVRDNDGNIIWKTAVSDTSDLVYTPEYDGSGALTGQSPQSRMEPQIQRAEQVPEAVCMKLDRLETDFTKPFWKEAVLDSDLEDRSGETFAYLKAELESILAQNGYEVPLTADGICSSPDAPVYSYGVRKGEPDLYGITTKAGQEAVKTVYGAAVTKIHLEDMDPETTMFELLGALLGWYRENPQWSFGGLHEAERTEEGFDVTLYAGASVKGSRRFFTMKQENGRLTPDHVYAVVENPKELRWAYQEYGTEGAYRYVTDRQYSLGSGNDKRYYLDVTLIPAVAAGADGGIQALWHRVMVYHQEGEEIVDYLSGDPEHGYRVPLTETVDKIEITTETETVETDVRLTDVTFDKKTGVHTIRVNPTGFDSYGNAFSDGNGSLTLTFMAKLPEKKKVLTAEDMALLDFGNDSGFQEGGEMGYADYLIRSGKGAVGVSVGGDGEFSDTFIVWKRLIYRGQNRIVEDGETERIPVQLLERPIRQKIKVLKETEDGKNIGNFRFKIYLKANLERLYCDEQGAIRWIDKNGNPVDIKQYRNAFPELVQKLYTEKTDRRILEKIMKTDIDSEGRPDEEEVWNYEKFFQAIHTANVDKWRREGLPVWNTSWKPFAKNMLTGIFNEINTSEAAKENAKRSDAVRQFAVTWYLEDEIEKLTVETGREGELTAKGGPVAYADEIYDKALYKAILKAEKYLSPFFLYDLDSVYEILWDSEEDGGVDKDKATLSANHVSGSADDPAYGISRYLPYGEYVISEQQPYRAEWFDFRNKHYKIDSPKEISLPVCPDENGEPMLSALVPWTMTEPGDKEEMSGYAELSARNRLYKVFLRIEKLDEETGEPVLHEDAVFGLYRAERNESESGDGEVKRYETDTLISGSRLFLEAMGADHITPFARGETVSADNPMYSGMVPAGTPICEETDGVIFRDGEGQISGRFLGLTTTADKSDPAIFQTTGYLETPEEIDAGVYVLAELKAPPGYAKSRPTAIEIYSDAVRYYPDGKEEPKIAVLFGNNRKSVSAPGDRETETEAKSETARIYVGNRPVNLEISKRKTTDSYRSMKLSGRVEGTITELKEKYGLENLELARNSMGTYLGFGWKKGTLEYLDSRRAAGERVETVYENGIFQGYGYVTKALKTADDEERYVPGAEMVLYEAIEIRPTGDEEDFRFEGIDVLRDRTGTVTEIMVREGFAGEKAELIMTDDGIRTAGTVKRGDTPVLFFSLDNLKVIERSDNGSLYGYDRSGERMKITPDTDSIYAIRDGRAEFELSGGDFSQLIYDRSEKAFTAMDQSTVIYHLGTDFSRDAQVDGYTGLAYVEKSGTDPLGREEPHYFVWPVSVLKSEDGTVTLREKILTGRPEEKNPGTSTAYITGTWESTSGELEKKLNPVYDRYGMVRYYPQSEEEYRKGAAVTDRDGEKVTYRYEDLLEAWNRAAYRILDHELLFSPDPEENEKEKAALFHRQGEVQIIPNVWKSGGKEELLKRIIPGTYILEEKAAPEGYVRALPVAVSVEESARIQRASVTDETIKVEIAKTDGTDEYRKQIWTNGVPQSQWSTEGTGVYTGELLSGIRMALYKAKRVYTDDYKTYPEGYYLEREDSEPEIWTTGDTPEYFEKIAAGDYILEELDVPAGYVPSSMELNVKAVPELQSFMMKNDHTKLEIIKHETDERGEPKLLSRENAAELTLYPAIPDENGVARTENGEYLYRQEAPVDSWKAFDLSEFASSVSGAYEAMAAEYGTGFQKFSWKDPFDHAGRLATAVLEESHVTGNGETVTQIWRLEDGSAIRVTAVQSGVDPVFEYQFFYRTSPCEAAPEMIAYDTGTGIHRLDRIPAGLYVLVETVTPSGYETAKPCLIQVKESGAVQRFLMENKRETGQETGKLVVFKQDAADEKKKLEGAHFEAENLQNGETYLAVTDAQGMAVFEDLPVKGPDPTGKTVRYQYRIREVMAPAGYQLTPETWYISFTDADRAGDDSADNRYPDGGDPEREITLLAKDRETVFSFSKSDFNTGHFVPGAELAIFHVKLDGSFFVPDGDPVETWISDDTTHKVVGKLSCGETYLLVEISAPEEYSKAPPVRFTISDDGSTITDISQNLSRIRICYREDGSGVDSVCVTGREAVRMHTVREKTEDLVFIEEILEFSDGSGFPVLSESFRGEENSGYQRNRKTRNPAATEYVLKNTEGIRIERWRSDGGQTEHSISNYRLEQGDEVFTPGKQYTLEEQVLLDDGTWLVTGKINFLFDENGNMETVDLLDRKTHLLLKKTDLVTGEELPGAELTLLTEEGEIVDRWISDETDHVAEGALIAGKTYILVEKSAPDGYETADEIRFTVSGDGRIDRVVMEDRKKEEPETPKEPEKPKPPEKPEEPDSPEKPKTPVTPIPEISKIKYGKIAVRYENRMKNAGIIYLDSPRTLDRIEIPKTGDPDSPGLLLAGMCASMVLICLILLRRRRKRENC